MADNHSFDIVSEVNFEEVLNAVNQTAKEIKQRYDLKDPKNGIEYQKKAPSLKRGYPGVDPPRLPDIHRDKLLALISIMLF